MIEPMGPGFIDLDGTSGTGSTHPSSAYPPIDDGPNAGYSMNVPSGAMPVEPRSASAYVVPDSTSYPSFEGVSATRFHEEAKFIPSKQNKSPKNVSQEYEPGASTQLPYRSSTISKPDKEMTLEETCLFCNLVTLFVNYEYDESKILTPSHVREALDSITGNNEIQGFREGKMACAQETFEEILRYMHREHIKPNYYEKY